MSKRSTGALGYTKRPKLGFSQQIRDFLLNVGSATAAEIRHGIARDKESARFMIGEVAAVSNRMAASGILSRERRANCSWYTIDKRRVKAERLRSQKGTRLADSMLSTLTKLAQRVKPDIRNEVLSEMYVRVASGEYALEQFEALLKTCKKWVTKEERGGWREELSIETPLDDAGSFKLLDTIPNEDTEFQKLFLLEERADLIIRMQREGYTAEQVDHLWCSAGTSWLHRVVS